MTNQPHNNFFITVFSYRQNMVDLLTQFLPDVAESIDIDSLQLDDTSYIDEKLDNLYSDIVYNCKNKKGTDVKVSLLFEHKSYTVAYPRFQLLDYILSIFRNNAKNNENLSLVIPIIFYHGETPWKYRSLTSYYKDIDEKLKKYIPDFEYHVIDLTQYSDENILSLKFGFLINSLIAFKHKNDSDYVRKQIKRIYYQIEAYKDTDYSQIFFRTLTVYLMISTKIEVKEIVQLVEKLPKEGQNVLKSTYENFVDFGIEKGIAKGIEKGISIGKERGQQVNKLQLALKAVNDGLEVSFIANFLEISAKLVKLIKNNVANHFQSKELLIVMANEVLFEFRALSIEDVASFCHLSNQEIETLKANLLED